MLLALADVTGHSAKHDGALAGPTGHSELKGLICQQANLWNYTPKEYNLYIN